MSYEIHHATSQDAFTAEAVEWIATRIRQSIATDDCCILGLSGGSTPRDIYTALGRQPDITWSKVYIFLIDDRYVAHADPRSNTRLLHETIIPTSQIPAGNVLVPDPDLPINDCMTQYATQLHAQWNGHLPHIIVLGIGKDGHIASLFPPLTPNLIGDTQFLAHTTTDVFDVHDRIGLTLNPIASAAHHLVILANEKKPTIDEMLASAEGVERWPLKRILEQEDVMVLVGPQV